MPEHPALSSDIEQTLPPGYHVVKLIGKGNFGVVYKAKGPGGKEWAFKVTDMSRGKAVGIKEFRAFRNIRRIKPHRNLIEYYGVWVVRENGEILENAHELSDEDLKKLDVAELIIQMPLAEESLEKRLKKARRDFNKPGRVRQPGEFPGIPLRELLVYMQGVAEALDHLHSPIHPLKNDEDEEGTDWMLHRDVKPGNILIDRTGNVLVADYGVARAVGANVTGTQGGAGTPIYSAPEQLTDHVPDPHPSSDQYSLAITYYELRTGSLPIPDESMSSVEDVKLAQILGRLDFSILPRNEVNVLKRATHKVMKQRYPSCSEFVAELWKANGVMPGRPSGIMPSPFPRTPYTDAEIALPPEPPGPPRTDSRTPFEMGTLPEIPPALRDPEPAPPVEGNKPSGTMRVEDLFRATPIKQPAVPPPAAPPPKDEELPIASEAAPWEAPAKPLKGKSTADFAVPPAKPDAKKGTDWLPSAKPKSSKEFELPPMGTAFYGAEQATPTKPNPTKETEQSPTGTAYYGADSRTATPKPASNPALDLDDEADSKPPTWIPQGQKKKKKISPLVWLAGGAGLAAAIGVGAFVLFTGDGGSRNAETKPTNTDGGGTGTGGTGTGTGGTGTGTGGTGTGTGGTGTGTGGTGHGSGGTGGMGTGGTGTGGTGTGGTGTDKSKSQREKLTDARKKLAGAVDKDEIEATNINEAVKLLAEIMESKDSDSVSKDEASTLHAAWANIETVLRPENKPSLAQAEAILTWPASVQLKGGDRTAWDNVYSRLRTLHPTATERLAAIRAFLRGDSLISALGAPGAVLANANVSRTQLAKFKELADADPSFSNDSTKAAAALDSQWNNAVAMREPGAANISEIEKWRDAIRKITLTGEDKAVLADFHRVRLANLIQRFAMKPAGMRSANDWSDLRLPTAEDLPGSAWREWLEAESKFLSNALRPTVDRSRSIELPKLSLDGASYEKLVSAELKWSRASSLAERREAARALLAAAVEAGPLLEFGSRKRALGVVLALSGIDLKQPKADAIDATFAATEADTALARDCFLKAQSLLEKESDASIKTRIGPNLLLASAFPKVVPDAAQKAGVMRTDIANWSDPAEKNSLWLAFARTRNRATAAGLDDALHAYAQLKDVKEARAALVNDLLDAGFRSDLKERDKAAEAVRTLFSPLATSLFDRRKDLDKNETELLAKLLEAATSLAKTDELAVLHAFTSLEKDGKLPAGLDAAMLHANVKSDRSLLLKELASLHAARNAKTPAEKLESLEKAAGAFERAVGTLRSKEPTAFVELLDGESLDSYLELGRLQTADGRYIDSITSFIKVKSIAGDNPRFASHLNQMMLARAKALWLSASDRETLKKTSTKSDLDTVIRQKEATAPEARYWRAVYALYIGEAIGCNSRKHNYEADKLDLLGAQSLKLSAVSVEESDLVVPADLAGPYRVELLEWKACFACAKAVATKDAKSRQDAMNELAELAKADPLAGAVRRLQFQVNRLEAALAAGVAAERDEVLKDLTSESAADAIASLKALKPSTRIPDSVGRDQQLLTAFASLARARSVADARAKTPGPGFKTLLEAIKDLKSNDPKSNDLKVIETVEDLAMSAAIDAANHQTDKSYAEAQTCALLAIQAFEMVGELDPDLKAVEAHVRDKLFNVAAFRNSAAGIALQEVKGANIDPAKLDQAPTALDQLIRIDRAFEQAAALFERVKADPRTAMRLETVQRNRKAIKSEWFDKGLDGAIQAAEGAGDAKRANALKKFQARLPK
ncbi:MAG: protein kinase [Gemmataceae bacterium]